MEYSISSTEWTNRNNIIRGTQYISPFSRGNWVIFCHGFTSHRIGRDYLFVTLARKLAQEEGINSLTFDFAGCGESDGKFADMTLGTMGLDLVSAFNHIKNSYNPARIFILGHSLGGAIAVLSTKSIKSHGLILLSPFSDAKKHAVIHSETTKKGVNARGYYENGPHEMKMDFFEEVESYDPYKAFSLDYSGQMLLIQGENDTNITVKESKCYIDIAAKNSTPHEYYIVRNADHSFSDVNSRIFIHQRIGMWIKENV